jgi:lysophospholipase L1-like esterase
MPVGHACCEVADASGYVSDGDASGSPDGGAVTDAGIGQLRRQLKRWSKQALRLAALLPLLAFASPRLAHAGADCTQQSAAVAARETGGLPFDWSTLPGLAAAPAPGAYRIGVWGDSLTSARFFIDAALQTAGVDKTAVRPSFIQAGIKVSGLSLPLKFACASAGWKTAYAYREKGNTPAFSAGLVSMESSSPGDIIYMDFRFPLAATRVSQLDMLYDKPSPGGSLLLGVSIDGQAEKLIPLSRAAAGVLRIAPQEAMSTLRIRLVSGQVKIHGFQPRYLAAPKVILDTFSVPGALVRGWNYIDERLLPGAPGAAQDYDLILIQYGTNEGASPAFNASNYADYLRTSLARVRQVQPNARCILIGPPDRGVAGGQAADPMKYSHIHQQIAIAQRQVSAQYRCSFWDWQGESGGPGTALSWARARPPFEQPDLTHMTAQGYEASGRAFARSYPFAIPKY